MRRDRPRDTYEDSWASDAVWRMIGRTYEVQQQLLKQGNSTTAADAFNALVAGFDFIGTTMDSIGGVDEGSNWQIQGIDRTNFNGPEHSSWRDDKLVRRTLKRSVADGVMTVRYTYFMSPDLRQVRLIAELRMYKRAPRDVRGYAMTLKRRYEYLSPPHARGLRDWHEGEKEAFLQTIEDDFADRTRQYPHNESAYRKDRVELRRALRRSKDRILLPDGMLEAWSQAELHEALQLAAERMASMIRTDLASLPAHDRVEGHMLTVIAPKLDGDPTRIRAREFFRDGENIVYQTGGGNLYSIPKPE